MSEIDVLAMAINNRWQQDKHEMCGCYYCCRVFDSAAILEWCDEETTALCPYCGVDSILFGVTDEAVLQRCGDDLFSAQC